MADVVEHRCKSCDAVAGTTRGRTPRVGEPFTTCRLCGGFVDRSPNDEWAMMGVGARLVILLGGAAFAGSAGLVPALAWASYRLVRGAAIDPLPLAVTAGAGLLVGVGLFGMRLSTVIRRSRRRMGDPMYRAKLVEFGIGSAAR